MGNRFQRARRQTTRQYAGRRHDHVIAAATGEQLGFEHFRCVEGVVAHMNAGFLLETLQGFGGNVIGPAVEIDDFVFSLDRGGHGQEQRG